MKTLSIGLLLTSLVTSACVSGSDFDDNAANVEGIYQVTSYTLNEDACAPGGASELGSDTFALAVTREAFGVKFLWIMSCASVADCAAKRDALDSADQIVDAQWGFTFERADAGGGLRGTIANTGFESEGVCVDAGRTESRLSFDGATLRIENQISQGIDYPAAPDNTCTSDGAMKATDGVACSQMEVFTAQFVQAI